MQEIKIIALDLDGTLLSSKKELSEENYAALAAAAEQGAEIVPTTGRFYSGMPEVIRNLPFVHYVITTNGAQVYDIPNARAIARAEIPWQQAVEVLSYLDTRDLLYDCYMDSSGWMTKDMKTKAVSLIPDPYFAKMVEDLRRPVPELKAFLSEQKHDVQKLQIFTTDAAVRKEMLDTLGIRFPGIVATSAVSFNVEINQVHANKGEALLALADYLGVDHAATMSFGDGLNDISMLKDAGVGVAMENGCPEVLQAADRITFSNDEDGVAAVIREYFR